MTHMNSSLEGLPESLKQLQNEMMLAAKDIEHQTYLLHNPNLKSGNKNESEINFGVIQEIIEHKKYGYIKSNDEKYYFSFDVVQDDESSIINSHVSFLIDEYPAQHNNNIGTAKEVRVTVEKI